MRESLARLDEFGRRHPWRVTALAIAGWIAGVLVFPLVALLPVVLLAYWVGASRLARGAVAADRPSAWRLVVAGALVWVAVGAGIATVVIAPTIFAWTFVIFHLAAWVAAVLGAIQGGWIALVRRDRGVTPLDWAVRGALLGIAGALLVFTGATEIAEWWLAAWWRVTVFLAAGVLGGAAAAHRTAALLVPAARRTSIKPPSRLGPPRDTRARPRAPVVSRASTSSETVEGHPDAPQGGSGRLGTPGRPALGSASASTPPRRLVRRSARLAAPAMLLGLIGLTTWLLWPRLLVALPTPAVSRAEVTIPPGDARGTRWDGCFHNDGRAAGPTSGPGRRSANTRLHHEDGRLTVMLDEVAELHGGIDDDGRFRVASERGAPDAGVVRERLDGQFLDDTRYRYVRRMTAVDAEGRVLNTLRHVGMGTRQRC